MLIDDPKPIQECCLKWKHLVANSLPPYFSTEASFLWPTANMICCTCYPKQTGSFMNQRQAYNLSINKYKNKVLFLG